MSNTIANRRPFIYCSFFTLSVLILISTGCNIDGGVQQKVPVSLTEQEIDRAMGSVPPEIGVSFSGINFLGSSLYVASNIGVFEVPDNDPQIKLFKWRSEDDVLSGPWMEKANHRLWFFHSGLAQFVTFDGRTWETIDLPMTETSRGSLHYGFSGLGNERDFWMQARTHAGWKWDDRTGKWSLISIPDIKCKDYLDGSDIYSCLASIAPTDKREFVVMHREFIGPTVDLRTTKATRPRPDRVFFLVGNKWNEVEPTNDHDFVVEKVVTAPNVAYLKSHYGPFFKLDAEGIRNIGSPGETSAFIATNEGRLIATVPRVGIFEFTEGWAKIFDCPYPPDFPVAFEYLAEKDGKLAFASVANISISGGTRSRLWISNDGALAEHRLP